MKYFIGLIVFVLAWILFYYIGIWIFTDPIAAGLNIPVEQAKQLASVPAVLFAVALTANK